MKHALPIVFLALSTSMGPAQQADEMDQFLRETVIITENVENLEQFVWKNRPIVVFADNAADPRFIEQMEFIEDALEELAERDVVVLLDTDPDAASALRKTLRPRGFMLVLIGKDGGVRLRKPFPWSVRELSRAIDKMPMRQQEIRDRRDGS